VKALVRWLWLLKPVSKAIRPRQAIREFFQTPTKRLPMSRKQMPTSTFPYLPFGFSFSTG
jgi:hypothetical protein